VRSTQRSTKHKCVQVCYVCSRIQIMLVHVCLRLWCNGIQRSACLHVQVKTNIGTSITAAFQVIAKDSKLISTEWNSIGRHSAEAFRVEIKDENAFVRKSPVLRNRKMQVPPLTAMRVHDDSFKPIVDDLKAEAKRRLDAAAEDKQSIAVQNEDKDVEPNSPQLHVEEASMQAAASEDGTAQWLVVDVCSTQLSLSLFLFLFLSF
jgi:hypothetical protein